MSNLTSLQFFIKRSFDIFFSFFGLILSSWLIVIAWGVAAFETRSNGFFLQTRVGKDGKLFAVVKIKTMSNSKANASTVTTSVDPRITKGGRFFRRTKIDELPQLWNVFVGDMSFVGPRPDVPGFADKLQGTDTNLLSIRPGITGPASLKYRNEEEILAQTNNPESYNMNVIWPDKVKINLSYIDTWSLTKDVVYIYRTLVK